MQRSDLAEYETHLQGVTNRFTSCGSGKDRAFEGRREDDTQGGGASESLVEEAMAIGGMSFGIWGGGMDVIA